MIARVDAKDVRKWIAGFRVAQEREQAELRQRPFHRAESITRALALIDVTGRHLGWPFPDDPVGAREDRRGRSAWTRLRRRYARQ